MMQIFEDQVQEYILGRCREHLGCQEKLLGRRMTFDYRYEHTRITVGIADNLAGKLGVDRTLARIAAWLHDIAKCWEPSLDEAANMARAESHGTVGAREAAIFLNSIGFPAHQSKQIEQAIAVHVGFIKDYILEEPLDALLWDADKLSKISGAGVLHYLGNQLMNREDVLDYQDFFQCLDRDFHQGIRNSLNTEIARQWADLELDASLRLGREMLSALAGNPPDGLDNSAPECVK